MQGNFGLEIEMKAKIWLCGEGHILVIYFQVILNHDLCFLWNRVQNKCRVEARALIWTNCICSTALLHILDKGWCILQPYTYASTLRADWPIMHLITIFCYVIEVVLRLSKVLSKMNRKTQDLHLILKHRQLRKSKGERQRWLPCWVHVTAIASFWTPFCFCIPRECSVSTILGLPGSTCQTHRANISIHAGSCWSSTSLKTKRTTASIKSGHVKNSVQHFNFSIRP